jgi:hypothetical protein
LCWIFSRQGLSTISWFQTKILLISASWVARITGVSHHCLAPDFILKNDSGCLVKKYLKECKTGRGKERHPCRSIGRRKQEWT